MDIQPGNKLRYDTAIDMWSFGCILAECKTQGICAAKKSFVSAKNAYIHPVFCKPVM